VSGLRQAFSDLRWQDVVDVAFLSFVLFRIYVWLRRTVALQVALGMLTLAAAAFAADRAGLVLTAYVLQAIGAVAVLSVVVIFREELRRALGQASPLRWWRERKGGGGGEGARERIYAPLGEALFALARERVGALVVVTRRDAIEEHVTGGTSVEAVVSVPLVEAIFQRSSPLHDGAMVIERDRVRLCGSLLPLSSSTTLEGAYGTRHRAALGLSEACDAVVLVVSEERGEVAIAVAGQLTPAPPSVDMLSRRLLELVVLEGHATRADASLRLVKQRRRQRLADRAVGLCILAGVIVAWHAVAGERSSVITRTVPVELRAVPAGLDFEPPQPSEVILQLRGPRRLLLGTLPADLHTSIDLSSAKIGHNDLGVDAAAPAGIQIVRLSPPRIKLEVLERKAVPVVVQLEGRFPRALRVREVIPTQVPLVGKAAVLSGQSQIRTRPIEAAHVKDHMARIALIVPQGARLADDRASEVVVLFEDTSPAAEAP
jgi:uncharacterized protein (TIGR00159 family)